MPGGGGGGGGKNIRKSFPTNFLVISEKFGTTLIFLILSIFLCPGHNNLEAKHLDRCIDKNHNLLNKLMEKTIIYKSDSLTKSINYKIDSWHMGTYCHLDLYLT